MKFSELAKYKPSAEAVISPRHEVWMLKNSNPVYSYEALEFGLQALEAQAHPRDRRGTISSSSLGSCRRKQQFTFLGMPELPPSPKTAAIFQNGTFMHVRWQMAGLTEGWMTEAEVPVGKNEFDLSGTMDGVLWEDSVAELKSCNSNSFRKVMSFGPLPGHEYQLGTYLLTTGREKGVFIYEDKDTQEYKEIVRTRDELPLEEIKQGAEELWESIGEERLHEPLDECFDGNTYKFKGCQFRDRCLKIQSWQEAKEIAG